MAGEPNGGRRLVIVTGSIAGTVLAGGIAWASWSSSQVAANQLGVAVLDQRLSGLESQISKDAAAIDKRLEKEFARLDARLALIDERLERIQGALHPLSERRSNR